MKNKKYRYEIWCAGVASEAYTSLKEAMQALKQIVAGGNNAYIVDSQTGAEYHADDEALP
jgi:hypothetical protein